MNTDKTQANKGNEKVPANWALLILSIPKIGELLTTLLAIAPAILLLLLLGFPGSNMSNDESKLSIIGIIFQFLIVIALTWWWLNYLERKINIAIILPIPFIKIPVKWLLYPFMLPFFGIHQIYRHFSHKR